MASDWYFGRRESRDFVEALAAELREAWDWVIEDLLADPMPDEFRRVTLPPEQFGEGVYATWSGPFWIAYRVPNPEVVEIAHVAWGPNGPNEERR